MNPSVRQLEKPLPSREFGIEVIFPVHLSAHRGRFDRGSIGVASRLPPCRISIAPYCRYCMVSRCLPVVGVCVCR